MLQRAVLSSYHPKRFIEDFFIGRSAIVSLEKTGRSARYLINQVQRVIFSIMKFENADGKWIEVNFQNFERIIKDVEGALTPVKLKNDPTEYWLKATQQEIVEAAADHP